MVTNAGIGKQLVFLSNDVPEDCVKRAQVAIVNESGWYIITPGSRMVSTNHMALPELACPVVDITPIRMDDDDKIAGIMAQCVDRNAGVINLSGLLSGLEALGAKVTPAKTSPSTALRATAADVQRDFIARKNRRVARRVHGGRMTVN